MSGIAGIIRFDGGPVASGLIEKMTGSMRYRGPDGINHCSRGAIALGQCMMRTTPESLDESQPLANEDGSLVLVMDGRVDNWEELRTKLLERSAILRTRDDAELVLRAYEVWGDECVAHVDGDFALMIWDERRGEVFCARDRLGQKPYYYYWDGRKLIVASELHAIFCDESVPKVLNRGKLAECLAHEHYSRDETLWRGVTRLVAAHRMRVDARGPRIERYWRPDFFAPLPARTEPEAAEQYRAIFIEEVRRKSRSLKPLSIEVSGGLDSSAIFAVADHLHRESRLPAPGFQGYSLVFPNEEEANEVEYARAVGAFVERPVREIPPTQLPYSWYAETAARYRDFPGFPNGIMALGIKDVARADGANVNLNGVGGDQWLSIAPYGFYYAEDLARGDWSALRACFARDRDRLGAREAARWAIRYGLVPLAPKSVIRARRWLRGDDRRSETWLSPELKKLLRERRAIKRAEAPPDFDRLGQMYLLDILEDPYFDIACTLEERTAASRGFELRSPFNSRAIVEFSFAIPERWRSRGSTIKTIHRAALRGILPEIILTRETKAGFGCTFRSQLAALGESAMRDIAGNRPDWVDSALVMEMYQRVPEERESDIAAWSLWTLAGLDPLTA